MFSKQDSGPAAPDRPRSLLIVSSYGVSDDQQLHAFDIYARELKAQLGLTVTVRHVSNLYHAGVVLDTTPHDAAILEVSWAEPPEALINFLAPRYARPRRPKLIFLDHYDHTGSPHFGVLPFVDAYVKRQVLVDRQDYLRDYRGGYCFTDYLERTMGYDIEDWHSGSFPDPALLERLVMGWNFGVTPRYRTLLRLARGMPGRWWWNWQRRKIDIHRRFLVSGRDSSWYVRYRRAAFAALEPLAGARRCTEGGRIARKRYYLEMLNSKIVVSPFGWGELCFRDFEAVACGALLVKPSVEHMETHPDIFHRNGRLSYVPVRWDLADLSEKCRYYLEHPEEAAAIARSAQEQLAESFQRGEFVDDLRRVLSQANRRGTRIEPNTHAAGAAASGSARLRDIV